MGYKKLSKYNKCVKLFRKLLNYSNTMVKTLKMMMRMIQACLMGLVHSRPLSFPPLKPLNHFHNVSVIKLHSLSQSYVLQLPSAHFTNILNTPVYVRNLLLQVWLSTFYFLFFFFLSVLCSRSALGSDSVQTRCVLPVGTFVPEWLCTCLLILLLLVWGDAVCVYVLVQKKKKRETDRFFRE